MTNWTERFFWRAAEIASWSKHPTRKVGCAAVDDLKREIGFGFYGLPRGMVDNERLLDRGFRHHAGVHAEANLIAAVARKGVSLSGCSLYVTAPPCAQCAGLVIQAGIKGVHWIGSLKADWSESTDVAFQMLSECGVSVKNHNCTPWAKSILIALDLCAERHMTMSKLLSSSLPLEKTAA